MGGSALTELTVSNDDMQLLDAPAAALMGDALRANSTLSTLTLVSSNLFADPAAAAALLGALTGHASLQTIMLCQEAAPTEQAMAFIAPALGGLIAANAPALVALSLLFCNLGDVGMRPLMEALPHNTHLKALSCFGSDMSAAFARDVLLLAVRANTSLLSLNVGDPHDAAVEAETLVAACRRLPPRIARLEAWCAAGVHLAVRRSLFGPFTPFLTYLSLHG
jgi:hypothetical protein